MVLLFRGAYMQLTNKKIWLQPENIVLYFECVDRWAWEWQIFWMNLSPSFILVQLVLAKIL